MKQRGFAPSYSGYLVMRGYPPSAGKLDILKRSLLESWAEPGFHNFWRVWNPGIGYLLYLLYLRLGGNRHRFTASMLVFAACGLAHDAAVMLIFRHPFIAFSSAFGLFGLLCQLARGLESAFHPERWPRVVNVMVNAALVAGPIIAAVHLQRYIFP